MEIDHSRKKLHRVNARKAKTPWAKYAKLILAGLIVIFFLYLVMIPLRVKGANKLLETGDNYLKERKYISAIVAYRKAQFLKNSEEIESRIQIARDSEKDISKLEPFLREINDIPELNEIANANKVPVNEYEGIVQAKKYVADERADLAILTATDVTEMDENYRDAWMYLGIANYHMMSDAEVSAEVREYYKAKARDALERAKSLDETNTDVTKYLEAVK